MNKTKAIIVVLIHAALAVFVVAAIWPALKVSSEGYNTKTSGVIVAQPAEVTEPIESDGEEPLIEEMSAEEAVTESEMPVAAEEPSPAPVVETEISAPEPTVEENVIPAEPVPTAEPTIHEVKALVTAFSPLVIFAQPGDLVAWGNMNGHDTQSLEGLIPEGAEAWHSKLGEDYQRTFTVEGVYIYKCTPHFGTGMGGVIIVGNPTNMDAIVATNQKGAAKRLVKKALKAIEAHTF